MTDHTRRLRAKVRQEIEKKLSGPVDVITMHNLQGICLNLLHDLDMANEEIERLREENAELRKPMVKAMAKYDISVF